MHQPEYYAAGDDVPEKFKEFYKERNRSAEQSALEERGRYEGNRHERRKAEALAKASLPR